GDLELADKKHVHTVRSIELALLRRAIEASRALLAGAGNAQDLATLGIVAANQIIFRIGNDHAAVMIHTKVLGAVHRGGERIAAVAVGAFFAGGIHDRANLSVAADHAQ